MAQKLLGEVRNVKGIKMAQIHNLTRNCVLIGAALSLSACSTLNSVAGSVWNGTENIASKAGNSVASLFRSAPKHDTGAAFLLSHGDETLNTQKLAARVAGERGGYYAVQRGTAAQAPVIYRSDTDRLRGLSAPSHSQLRGPYKGYQSYERGASFERPIQLNWQESAQESAAPRSSFSQRPSSPVTQDGALSYVKIGGGSTMAEWQSCEAQAGGYFVPSAGGFTVMPAFDRCMRGHGYITEAEAEAKFASLEARNLEARSHYAP